MLSFRKRNDKARVRRLRPRLEGLEGRVVLSTFHVNTTLDTVAVNLKTGKDASGDISLRSAIMAADANPKSDTIVLPAGTFTLTIPPTGGDGSDSGDLDISANLTIKGSKNGQTVIDGNSLDRVFDILSGKVAISNVVIEHGRAVGEGGGILNSGGKVTLTSVQLFDNVAVGDSGANGADGVAGAPDGTAGGAGAAGTVGEGGAIFNAAGSLTLSTCFISTNQAIGGNGGNGGNGGFGGNINAAGTSGVGGAGGNGGAGAAGEGGGVFNAAGATLTVSGDTFFANKAIGGNGGAGGGGNIGAGGIGGAGTGGAGGAGGCGRARCGRRTVQPRQGHVLGRLDRIQHQPGDRWPGRQRRCRRQRCRRGRRERCPAVPAGPQARLSAGQGALEARAAPVKAAPSSTVPERRSPAPPPCWLSPTWPRVTWGAVAAPAGSAMPLTVVSVLDSQSAELAARPSAAMAARAASEVLEKEGACSMTPVVRSPSRRPAKRRSPAVSNISTNQANGGGGGSGGQPGNANAGIGGNSGFEGEGGRGGSAQGGAGGNGGSANEGAGGGLFNAGVASFTGVTVNFSSNQATGAVGGNGAGGGIAVAGRGGNVAPGGVDPVGGGLGGSAVGGNGGNGGESGIGIGGGVFVANTGTFTLKPRLGAKKGSKQASATDVITANQANAGSPGSAGLGGSATGGAAGTPGGLPATRRRETTAR